MLLMKNSLIVNYTLYLLMQLISGAGMAQCTLRAEPLFLFFFLSGQETEKDALHKSVLTFEVAVAPTLRLVIPVYFRQTGFSSASINFYEKPMVETEPTEKHVICVWPGFETVS